MSETWIGLAVALGVGLLVGIERERRKGSGPGRGAAGMRTFALVTLAGALAQSLAPGALVAVGALAVATLAALAYWRGARSSDAAGDPGLTTEVALLVAYLIGAQCVVQPAVGAACGALLAALLAARERIHRFATEWLTELELRDALVLAALALIVMPLAPTTPWPGLGGLAPRTAAWLVLMILAIQASAHLARRLFGERHALRAAGLLGGFVSSTATIATFGARARRADATTVTGLAGAASLSGAATWLQCLALAAVVSPALLPRLLPVALVGAAVALGIGAWASRASQTSTAPATPTAAAVPTVERPLRVREALIVAALLLGISVVVHALQARFGTQGLWVGTALAALVDAHAAAASGFALHAQGTLADTLALQTLWLSVAVNSASRSAVAFATGGGRYGVRVSVALLASALGAGAVLLALSR